MTNHAARLISSSIIVATGSISFAIGSLNNRDDGMTMGFCVGAVGAVLFLRTWFADGIPTSQNP